MLNRGGPGNPDVLLIDAGGPRPRVVKDYGPRWAPVRALAPLLLRHELAMLERARGLPGLPGRIERLDGQAFAMDYLEGSPLSRARHQASLPPTFFDALEGILDGLAQRGLLYLDLASPSNVLTTASGAPALVDLASATGLPLPGFLRAGLRRRVEDRALAKLRDRFEGNQTGPEDALRPWERGNLKLGGTRVSFLDRGRGEDPVPALLLHDVGLCGTQFAPLLDGAAEAGRRGIAIDLPGFGTSRRRVASLRPRRVAVHLERLLDALRVRRVDAVGSGWGGLIARALAARAPDRVRAVLTVDTPVQGIFGRFRERLELSRDPESLRERLWRELPALGGARRAWLEAVLTHTPARSLRLAYRHVPLREAHRGGALELDPDRVPAPAQPWLAVASEAAAPPPLVHWRDPLGDAARFWKELATLGERAAP